jgi:D-3-phosphoglycerate dehydrogenase
VLVSCPLIQDAISDYDDVFEAYGIEYDAPDVDQQLSESQLIECIEQYDGVIAGDDHFTEAVFNVADQLSVVSKWGIGVDNINFEAAAEAEVEVTNTPGAFDDEVADVVLGYAIMLTRDLHLVDREVRNGNWFSPRGVSLPRKTFGVVGLGSIGSAVARRAHAHGMDIIGNDVHSPPDDLVSDTGIEQVSKAELFERADVISLNCALNPETRQMVGEKELDAIGQDSYLVNTARGELVDESALVEALQNGDIAGAALDVFESEPLPEDDPLTDLDNVILGSHNAQNTHRAVAEVNDRTVANLVEELTGERPGL